MNEPRKYYLKFIGNERFVCLLKEYSALYPDDLKIESEMVEEDAARLGFDINKAAAVATIISLALYTGDLASKIPTWMADSNSDTVLIQTPFASIELNSSKPLTPQEIRELLQLSQRIMINKDCKK